ncbi:MAG: OsmC family peroxiredoxin [Bacteroidetes bacterium]|nr:OsmC family peroxiredoxin [Bacteroidota bacterium]
MTMKRRAEALWKGSAEDGSGMLTTQSGVLHEQPYSVKLRFENEDGKAGTNPEELIGAAHAGCYAMALSVELGKAGYTPDSLHTEAHVNLEQVDGGWAITKVDLKLDASVPEIDEDEFDEIANGAKEGCPVSKVLDCEITLDYSLNS